MIHLLNEYLLDHKALYLKDIGQLQWQQKEAIYDVVGRVIHPPKPAITLLKPEEPSSVQPLTGFIARRLNIAEEQAFGLYAAFSQAVSESLNDKGFFEWVPFGRIMKAEKEGPITFQLNDHHVLGHQTSAHAERIIREGSIHAMQVGDKETTNTAMQEWLDQEPALPRSLWWIWPMILGVLALGLIFWKRYGM